MTTEAAIQSLIAEMKTFTATVKEGGNLGVGSGIFDEMNRSIKDGMKMDAKARAEEIMHNKRVQRAVENYEKGVFGATGAMNKLIKNSESLSVATALAGRSFENMVEKFDIEELEAGVDGFVEHLKQGSSDLAKSIAGQIKGAEDMIAASALLTDQFIADFEKAKALHDSGQREEAADLMEQYNQEVDILTHSTEDLYEAQKDLSEGMAKTVREMEGGALQGIERFGKKAMAAAALLGAVAQPMIQTAKSAAQTGTQMEFLNAALAGMTPEELNQLQAENKQAMRASNMSFDEFNEKIRQGTVGLITYTGSLRDANRINAASMDIATTLGANQQHFMEQQAELFKKLNRGLSMSAEQFMEMNKQLMSSSSVQAQLYKINLKQRGAYMQDLQNTYTKLRTDGLMHEQAMRMLETFEQIGAKSPKERLKEAAKLQAVMGAMGMGQEGARAGELLRGGLRNEGDKAEFSEIIKNANISMGQQMGQSFQSELMSSAMIQAAGLQEYLGPESKFAELNTQQGKQMDDLVNIESKLGGERNEHLANILAANDALVAAINGPILMTLGAIAAGVAASGLMKGGMGKFGRGTGKFGRSMGAVGRQFQSAGGFKGEGALGKALGGAGKVLGKIPLIGGLFAGGLAGASKYSELAGSGLTEGQRRTQATATGVGAGVGTAGGAVGGALAGAAIGSVVPVIGTAIGGVLGAALGAFGGEWLGTKAGESVGEMLSETNATLGQQATTTENRLAQLAQEMQTYGSDPKHEQERLELLREQIKLQTKANEIQENIQNNTNDMSEEEKKLRAELAALRGEAAEQHEETMSKDDKGYRVQWIKVPKAGGITNAAGAR